MIKTMMADKYNSFLSGMLLQFVNPKGILYGITAYQLLSFRIILQISAYYFSLFLGFVGFLSTM